LDKAKKLVRRGFFICPDAQAAIAAPRRPSVLSLRRCREILGSSCPAADSELELLRDQLMAIADIALEMGREKLGTGTASTFHETLELIPREQQEEIVERAAIMEFDGGLRRGEAEEAALQKWARAQLNGKCERIN